MPLSETVPGRVPGTVPVVPADSTDKHLVAAAQATAAQWNIPFLRIPESGLVLMQHYTHLGLKQIDEPKVGEVMVDFASDALTYRKQHGGGKKEAIAKAVGAHKKSGLHVIDATAGLGRDSFVLASVGCKIDMIERSPIVAALLSDGLARAESAEVTADWLPEKMALHHGIAYELLENWEGDAPDAIYLDPMFPHKQKSAMVKKEMRLFQQLLGGDDDADKLLKPAIELAKTRVVVKRPDHAPHLADVKPSMAITSKKHRFDVYLR